MNAVAPTAPKVNRHQYQIHEDNQGTQYVLLKELRLAWIGLKLGPTPSLVLLSSFNLDRMNLVGRVTWER